MLKKSALFFAVCALSAPVFAQTGSSSTISNFSYRLVDLDLNDGIAPSLTFTRTSSVSSSVASVVHAGFDSFASDFSGSATPLLSSQNSALGAVTSAGISGMDLAAGGQVNGAGEYYSSASQSTIFSLSAHTQLIVTGHASASADTVDTLVWPDQASGSLFVQIIDSQHAMPFSQISYYSKGAYSYSSLPQNIDEDFTLSFMNARQTTLDGTMDLYVGASAAVTAVPEPETYGMLLGGMALLGAIAFRQRKFSA